MWKSNESTSWLRIIRNNAVGIVERDAVTSVNVCALGGVIL